MTTVRLSMLLVAGLCAIGGSARGQSGAASHVAEMTAQAGLAPPEGEAVKCGLPGISFALAHTDRDKGLGANLMRELLSRPEMQMTLTRGGFRVHFDTSGLHTPAMLDPSGNRLAGTAFQYVDSVFAILSYVGTLESVTLGYGPLLPDGTNGGGPEYDVYILELGNMYGFTTPDNAVVDGGTSSTYITIDNDFVFVRPSGNRGIPGLRVTLAHELHHALQIGNYGYWTSDSFLYEITSTWMEDVAYPDVNDYYNYLTASWGHFKNPEQPFTSGELIMYSRSIWGHFISKKFGRDAMRSTWEQVRLARPILAIDNALRLLGSGFPAAFADWILWNSFTGPRADPIRYYDDGAAYPIISQAPVYYIPPSRDVFGSLAPLGSKYYQVMNGTDTMTVILGNTDVASSLGPSSPQQQFSVLLRSGQPDASFRSTPIGLYGKLDVQDPALWATWYTTRDSIRNNVDPAALREGRAFPNPFKPNGRARVYIPIDGNVEVRGTLYIFTAGSTLIASSGPQTSAMYLGRQMFSWDGNADGGGQASTGIYVFVLELPDRRVTGKIALVKE